MNEQRIRVIFRISVILKGLHALLEIAGGLLFYFINTTAVLTFVNYLTQNELVEDPRDYVATHMVSAAEQLTGATLSFYALYLLSHGIVKVLLVIGLLREKLIAYPISLIVMGAFIGYLLYRYSYTQAVGLLVLTVFDLIVIVLIWHEWRLLRRRRSIE